MMRRLMSDCWFFIHEGYLNFSRSKIITLFSIIIIAVSLSMITVFSTVFRNVELFLEKLESKPVYSIFLVNNVKENELKHLIDHLNKLEGVSEVNYMSAKKGKETLLERFSVVGDIAENLDENPVPPSIRLRVDKQDVNMIGRLTESFPIIEEIYSPSFFVDKVKSISGIFSTIFLIISIILIIASVFTIYNVVRITIYARQTDIDIMQLVGASMVYIRMPFIVEGLFQGLSGGLVGVLFGNGIIYSVKKYYLADMVTFSLIQKLQYLPFPYILNIVLLSSLFGLLGSFIAASRIDYV